ncbi:hypothetical protein Tco_0934171, partial [Tanacetum coccineum]
VQFPPNSEMDMVKSYYPGEDAKLTTTVDNMTIRKIQSKVMPGDNDNEEKVVIII